MHPLRIAMISEHANPLAALGGVDAGGQNVHVAELAAALARRGHEVRVYTRRDSAQLPDTVRTAEGVTVEHVPAGPPILLPKDDLLPYMGEFGSWLARRWQHGPFRPDVVHAHFWMSAIAATEANEYRRRPLVVTFHALGSVKRRMQGAQDTSPRDRLEWERRVAHAADRVIAQCRDEVRELSAYGIGWHRLSVIPSGVDIDRFSPAGSKLRPRDRGRMGRILTVGRMVPRKGFADVLGALAHVPDAELIVAGGPPPPQFDTDPLVRRLREQAHEHGVARRVRLLGSVSQADMTLLYRSVDVLACAPAYEPFGITPLEAMASGVPVVTYAVGGLTDTVVHGETGIHVPVGDRTALGAALHDLLADEQRRLAFARAALARARSRYSWSHIADQTQRLYADVIRTPGPVEAATVASTIDIALV